MRTLVVRVMTRRGRRRREKVRRKRVLLAPSGQAASVELASRCKKTGRIQPVMSEHFARLKAAEVDANVAQVLTATTMNGRVHRLDVRFWSCPGNVAKLRFEG